MQVHRICNCQNLNFSAIRIPNEQINGVDEIINRFLRQNYRVRTELKSEKDASGVEKIVRYIKTRFHSQRENDLLAELQVHDPSIIAVNERIAFKISAS